MDIARSIFKVAISRPDDRAAPVTAEALATFHSDLDKTVQSPALRPTPEV